MLTREIYIPIYNRRIGIIQGNKEEIIDWYWQKYKTLLEIGDNFSGFSMSAEDGYYICYENIISVAVLNHEVGHIVFDIGSDLGIHFDADNAETFLYLQEYIIRQLIDVLKLDKTDSNPMETTYTIDEDNE